LFTAEAIEQERSSPDAFSQQSYYFMELACLLLEHAKSCFASNEEYVQVGDCVKAVMGSAGESPRGTAAVSISMLAWPGSQTAAMKTAWTQESVCGTHGW
jgi:hypothetical protein